ncbi:MAG: hypothetical protein M3O70_21635 [Actinomycetota bacterium]|nr:hypothetical protein [Actinomycetota bacterium]
MAKPKTDPQAVLRDAEGQLFAARDRAVAAFERLDELRLEVGRAQAALARDGLPQELKGHAQRSRQARLDRAEEALRRAEEEALGAAEGVRAGEAAVRAAELEVHRPEIDAGHQKIRELSSRYVDALLEAHEVGRELVSAYDELEGRGWPTPPWRIYRLEEHALRWPLEVCARIGAPVRGSLLPLEVADHIEHFLLTGIPKDFRKRGLEVLEERAAAAKQQAEENKRVEEARKRAGVKTVQL